MEPKTMTAQENSVRPFDTWTLNYVRREVAAGRLTVADAQRFATAFGDGMTLAEALPATGGAS
jgi:hypothetical protein